MRPEQRVKRNYSPLSVRNNLREKMVFQFLPPFPNHFRPPYQFTSALSHPSEPLTLLLFRSFPSLCTSYSPPLLLFPIPLNLLLFFSSALSHPSVTLTLLLFRSSHPSEPLTLLLFRSISTSVLSPFISYTFSRFHGEVQVLFITQE